MNVETQKSLWEELKILQGIVNKFDDFSFRIKNWFLTIFAAITGYVVVKEQASLALLNFGLIAIFYLYEATYRVNHLDFLKRLREVQSALRQGNDPRADDMPPNFDKYLFADAVGVPESYWYVLQRKVGVPETRAKRNIREWRTIFAEAFRLLFQLRVSLPYLAALIVNVLALAFAF